MQVADSLLNIQVLPTVRTAHQSRGLGIIGKEWNKTMLKKILAVLGIALGISTATEPSVIPFICMGVGLLMLTSEVEKWE